MGELQRPPDIETPSTLQPLLRVGADDWIEVAA